jgi:hypothetical protein
MVRLVVYTTVFSSNHLFQLMFLFRLHCLLYRVFMTYILPTFLKYIVLIVESLIRIYNHSCNQNSME